MVAVLTFLVMWHARRITTKVPPLLVGLGCGIVLYYALVAIGLGDLLGPVIGQLTASAAMRTVLVDFSGLAMAQSLEHSATVILSGALALAIIASIDALLCAKLASQPGELRAGDDRLLIRLGIANAVSAGFGGITNGINIGPSLVNRAFGGKSFVSVLVNAGAVLLAATVLFPLLAYIPRAVLSATIMVIAIQHIDPWTKQLAARLIAPGTPQRGAIALDLGVSLFVSVLSITINIVLAVFIGIALAVLLFVVRMSRSNIRRLYRCDAVRSRRFRDPAELEVLHRPGRFRAGDRTAGRAVLRQRRSTGADRRHAKPLREQRCYCLTCGALPKSTRPALVSLAISTRHSVRESVRLALILSDGTETAARLADIFPRDRFFRDIDRAIEWAEDELLRKPETGPSLELPLDRLPLLRDFTADDDRKAAYLAGASILAGRSRHLSARRFGLVPLSRHPRPGECSSWARSRGDIGS